MPDFPDEKRRRQIYSETLRTELKRVEKKQNRLHVPNLKGQWETRHQMIFHATPEIFFQLGGENHFTLPYGSFVLKPGETAIIPRGMPHREKAVATEAPFQMMIGALYRPDLFSYHIGLGSLEQRVVSSPFDHYNAKDQPWLGRLLDQVVTVHEEVQTVDDPQIRGLFMAYLALALRRIEGKVIPSDDEPVLVQRCRQLIFADMADPDLSVGRLARQLGCSSDHLSRVFYRATGKRLSHYIQQSRIEQAVHILESSDLKIAAVAWSVGFRDPSYFNRIFVQLRGTTPNAIRKR